VLGLTSAAMFTFLLAWDEFFFASIFTSTPIILAFVFQRYIVSGMTAGAVKGRSNSYLTQIVTCLQ
jgi:multiple sugar transport system permease protein